MHCNLAWHWLFAVFQSVFPHSNNFSGGARARRAISQRRNECSHHQKLFSNWSCSLHTFPTTRFLGHFALAYPQHLLATLPFSSLASLLFKSSNSGGPEYRFPTHPTMPPYSSAQKQAITQFVAFTQAKDALAAKVLISWSLASFWLWFASCRPNLMSRETSWLMLIVLIVPESIQMER